MAPDMIVALMTVVLLLLYGVSQALTWYRNGGPARLIAVEVAPPQRRRPRVIRRRSQADIRNERTLIQAGLAAGLDAAFIARCLRGSSAYNQHRVSVLAKREQATN